MATERRSVRHGPRIDEEMTAEVASITRGAPVEARSEPFRLMEDSGDGEPEVGSVPHEPEPGPAGLSRSEVRARSDLGRHLRGSIFPADRAAIVACAVEEHADPEIVGALRTLPDGEFDTVEDVWEALGGRPEPARAVMPDPGEPGPGPVPGREPVTAALRRFGFRFATPFRLAAIPFLVRPHAAWVAVDPRPGGLLTVRYGPWCVTTPVTNIRSAEATGPFGLVRTIGPPRVSVRDRGLTFASNRDLGVCIRFAEPVRGIDALGVVRHPALTVTVDDVAGLLDMLEAVTGGAAVA